MRFCSYYVAGSQFYFISEKLNKCKHCIQLDYSCNLTISSAELDCISEEI